jgi:GNAT superfamily N-acetyltransferase
MTNETSFQVRNLQRQDLAALSDLWLEFASHREGITRSKILSQDSADYFLGYASNLIGRRDALTLVAVAGGRLVGYFIAIKQRKPPIYRHTQVAYISDSFVVASHRRKGVLKRFMAELERWTKREAITAIDVNLFHSNAEAQDVYRSLGFQDYRVLLRRETTH